MSGGARPVCLRVAPSGPPLRIGVIADTHGLLRPEAPARLRGVDRILHAGDVGRPEVLSALGAVAPVTAIRGNVDRGAWARALPPTVTLGIAGLRVHMLHNLAEPGPEVETADVVIAGHSHRAEVELRGGRLVLNPGSAGPRRFRLPVTLMVLELREGRAWVALHDLLAEAATVP